MQAASTDSLIVFWLGKADICFYKKILFWVSCEHVCYQFLILYRCVV